MTSIRPLLSAAALFFISISTFTVLSAGESIAETTPVAGAAETQSSSISFTPSQQFNSGFKNGGSVGASRYYFDISANKGITNTLGIGFDLTYELADFRFSSPTSFSGIKPWGTIHHLELAGIVSYDLDPEWSIYLTPTVFSAREDGAGWNNSLGYGGDVTITRDFSPTLTLGLGLEGFSELDSVSILPLIIVNWKITDRLLLTNPTHSSPLGQTGFELSYRLTDSWSAATGVGYLSKRFRLNNSTKFNGGVAETSSFPTWSRISYKVGQNFNVTLLGGVALGGWMCIDDADGHRVASDRFDPAPILAFSFTGHF